MMQKQNQRVWGWQRAVWPGLLLALCALLMQWTAACDSETQGSPADMALVDQGADAGSGDLEPDQQAGDTGAARDRGGPDATRSCTACHGSKATPAPPLSLGGKTATSERGVGAHQAHIGSSTWHAEVQCKACHIVPTELLDKGHIDTAKPAEVTFSGLALAGKSKPTWDGISCGDAYCHGATLSGGSAPSPVWTQVDGSQSKCGSCHGMPPTSKGHPASLACQGCHKAVVAAKNKIIAPGLHIDGKVTYNKVGGSHTVHIDKADARGPGLSCDGCHDPKKIPYFKAGKDNNGDGLINLAETSVCDQCHSPGGSHDGVTSKNGSVGAKTVWAEQVYQNGALKAGKERWCAGCHDESPAKILSVAAPNIVGNQGAATSYGKGYGYYSTGHGLDATKQYPASGGTVPGAGLACAACHDASMKHLDGIARTYLYSAAAGTARDYQHGYRLKSVAGLQPLTVPRKNGCASSSGVKANEFRLCLGCHPAAPFTTPAMGGTNFRRDGGKNAHYYHLSVKSSCGPGPMYTSDWRSHTNDSQASCPTCHNVHGSTQLSMVRDGKLVGRSPGLQVAYYKPGVTYQCGGPGSHPPTPANVGLSVSTGTVWRASTAPLCKGCHGGCGFSARYLRAAVDASPPFIRGVHGKVGSNKLSVLFSDQVYSGAKASGSLAASDFQLTDADNKRLVIQVSHQPGERSAVLTLSSNLDGTADLGTDTLAAALSAIFDGKGKPMLIHAKVVAGDSVPPAASDLFPSSKATGVNRSAKLTFTLADTGAGVDWASLAVKISGDKGYSQSYTMASAGVLVKTGTPTRYQVTVAPKLPFGVKETVTPTISVKDILGNVMPPRSWTFTTGSTP